MSKYSLTGRCFTMLHRYMLHLSLFIISFGIKLKQPVLELIDFLDLLSANRRIIILLLVHYLWYALIVWLTILIILYLNKVNDLRSQLKGRHFLKKINQAIHFEPICAFLPVIALMWDFSKVHWLLYFASCLLLLFHRLNHLVVYQWIAMVFDDFLGQDVLPVYVTQQTSMV